MLQRFMDWLLRVESRKVRAARLLGTFPHCPLCGKRFAVGCEPGCN